MCVFRAQGNLNPRVRVWLSSTRRSLVLDSQTLPLGFRFTCPRKTPIKHGHNVCKHVHAWISNMVELDEETELLKEHLDCGDLQYIESRSGYINEGKVFETTNGQRLFAKVNRTDGARSMFEGEVVSLNTLASMEVVRVPKPIKILDIPTGGAILAMEFLDMTEISSQQVELGEKVARLHLHNEYLRRKAKKGEHFVGEYERRPPFVDQFGFDVPTCVGSVPQTVSWTDEWTVYYSNLLEYRVRLIEKETPANEYARDVRELWTQITRQIPAYFRDIDVRPSLLHGDLHRFNAGEIRDEEPVTFDPACFYGHSECDLGAGYTFPGFNEGFYEAYFRRIPKADGFDDRTKLYILNPLLTYWNHFGPKKHQRTIDLMTDIANKRFQ